MEDETNQHHQTILNKKKHEEEEDEGETEESFVAAKPKSSPSSSPAHEFSFTISLHSSSPSSSSTTTTTTTFPDNNNNNKKTKTTPSSLAIDLSPADEIFFHGHLLPLHLLSHLSAASPRSSSTNSLDSFTLPIEDLNYDNKFSNSVSSNNIKLHDDDDDGYHHQHQQQTNGLEQTKGRPPSAKFKSFSLFGFGKWRKGYEVRDQEDSTTDVKKDQKKQKKKQRFDVVSHVIKKYVRMVRPLVLFRGRRRENGRHFERQPDSFSGNLSFRNEQEQMMRRMMMRGRRRGEFSAPASIRTSPTNSGLLVSTANVSSSSSSSSSSDSTMEELHSAIQAAIAHCKNSIAVKENSNAD